MHQAGVKCKRVALRPNTPAPVVGAAPVCAPVVMLHGRGCTGGDASPRLGTGGGHLFKISLFCVPPLRLQLSQNRIFILFFFPEKVFEKIFFNEMLWGM